MPVIRILSWTPCNTDRIIIRDNIVTLATNYLILCILLTLWITIANISHRRDKCKSTCVLLLQRWIKYLWNSVIFHNIPQLFMIYSFILFIGSLVAIICQCTKTLVKYTHNSKSKSSRQTFLSLATQHAALITFIL